MEKLDINIALDIVSRVGEDSFKALGGMLLASKFYHYLASHPIVLNNVSLQPSLQMQALLTKTLFIVYSSAYVWTLLIQLLPTLKASALLQNLGVLKMLFGCYTPLAIVHLKLGFHGHY
ncbi:predicted protein [Arabidopsis lyrata subsp. lyrata]|uniref:Predicted protein n=1 Tax=Arabidopsis lyrata subsp. lyrata TaxID=81972 RepID=D7MUU9_ARALL|nr:predicted protein [Arabidopsis lyrata subsp. lyrata]